jgi:hypothetical protein
VKLFYFIGSAPFSFPWYPVTLNTKNKGIKDVPAARSPMPSGDIPLCRENKAL